MTTHWKDNKILLAGILLPVLMMLIFLLASLLPNYFVAPPQYDVVFMVNGFLPEARVEAKVINNQLQISFSCVQSNCQNGQLTNQRLYLYKVKSNQLVQFPLTPPVIPKDSRSFSTQLNIPPALAQLNLNPNIESPDGYVLNTNYNNAAFIGGFFYSDNPRKLSLNKMGKIVLIPLPLGRYDYSSIQFLGWVLPKT